jgi:hypothetical protein
LLGKRGVWSGIRGIHASKADQYAAIPELLRDATMDARSLALLLATLAPLAAWAGRPLATDDAATAEEGTCQLESWVEHSRGGDGAFVVSPACALAKDIELDAEAAWPRHRDVLRGSFGLALKLAPETWKLDTSAGALAFGVKFGTSFERPAAEGWRSAESGALALATLLPSDAWALHANVGATRDRASGSTAGLLNLALVWTPRDDALLFAETQANSRNAVFGGTVSSAGGRWWPVKDRFGIDLTASHENGAGTGTSWTLGFGWYGLTF